MGCPTHLLFELVEGEERREVALADGVLSYAVADCRSGRCAGTIVLIHGVASMPVAGRSLWSKRRFATVGGSFVWI